MEDIVFSQISLEKINDQDRVVSREVPRLENLFYCDDFASSTPEQNGGGKFAIPSVFVSFLWHLTVPGDLRGSWNVPEREVFLRSHGIPLPGSGGLSSRPQWLWLILHHH